MKKKEFKKLLKEQNHPIIKDTKYLVIAILILFIMLGVYVWSVLSGIGQNIIPPAVIIIITAMPIMILDIIRDVRLCRLRKDYEKENKIPDQKSLSIPFIVTIVLLVIGLAVVISLTAIDYQRYNDDINKLEIETTDGQIINLERYEFEEANFSIKLPKDFKLMDEELLKVKYNPENLPTHAFSNEEGNVNVSFNLSNVEMFEYQIRSYVIAMEDTYLEQFGDVETSFFEKDGHTIGVIKCKTTGIDTTIYNHLIAFSENNELKLVSFNCTEELEDEWKPVADFIMDSIKFNY